ncbi:membrane-associated phospholipid phosphatase [Mucilaginibacter yixingensis]|uniref:Membrane-associated phospholipid phosphatase n=1 Tax=Mucilaginibacter yixingensis TaxID=1295612 RepID=A0A2T5J847_9SPHI|nr:phosphatase PAP2 family protein [Mucilaginibacter yixingensis]PTQ95626.1 membrane-associated phospholipid phosphatase [Mucilaginibacter yixingensis]
MDNDFQYITLLDIYRKVKFFLIPYLVILMACLTIKCIYTREQIYFAVNGVNSGLADAIFPYITNLGDGLAVVLLGLIMALFSLRKAFLLLTAYGFTALVAQVLKYIFDLPRPYLYFKTQVAHMHLVKGVYMLSYHSFPSGHTVTAFSACITLAYLFRNKWLDVLMLIVAILIGYSRMYLSEHFFEDVTAGSAVGVFATLFWLYWFDNLRFMHKGKFRGGLIKKAGS